MKETYARYGTRYGVATIRRLLKIKRLFCRISALLWGSSAKETYNFKEPTNYMKETYARYGTRYGVATISRLLKIKRLFCRISALLWGSFAKETYKLKEPTNRSHPVCDVFNKRIFLNHSRHTHIYIKETIYVYKTDVCNVWKERLFLNPLRYTDLYDKETIYVYTRELQGGYD